MASGYGLNGGLPIPTLPEPLLQSLEIVDRFLALGTSRCFPFWQELLGCYVVNASEGEASKKKCIPALEDYYECLHHRKEVVKTIEMQNAYRKAIASHPRENAPRAEQISSLGLLGKEEETKAVLASIR